MANKISENLSKPIKIQSIATEGEGLHRTLEKLKSLGRLPLIIIYIGASEEYVESRFNTKDLQRIRKNLSIYKDDRIQTALMIAPWISRLVYQPVDYKVFNSKIGTIEKEFGQIETLKRNEISFLLFEQEINDLFTLIKDRGSYLIASSTPINLDAAPKKSCDGSIPEELNGNYIRAKELYEQKDFKQAYNLSKELALIANSSAQVLHFHGLVSKRIGKLSEAVKYLELASAYDCQNWRGNPVYNQIIESAAKTHDVAFFDFQKMLKDNWGKNITFQDEIYPQNFYMEEMASALAARIKKLLKL